MTFKVGIVSFDAGECENDALKQSLGIYLVRILSRQVEIDDETPEVVSGKTAVSAMSSIEGRQLPMSLFDIIHGWSFSSLIGSEKADLSERPTQWPCTP